MHGGFKGVLAGMLMGLLLLPSGTLHASPAAQADAVGTEANGIILDAAVGLMNIPGGLVVNGTTPNIRVRNVPDTAVPPLDLVRPDGTVAGTASVTGTDAYFTGLAVDSDGLWRVTDSQGTSLASFHAKVWQGESIPLDASRATVFTNTATFKSDLAKLYGAAIGGSVYVGRIDLSYNPASATCTPNPGDVGMGGNTVLVAGMYTDGADTNNGGVPPGVSLRDIVAFDRTLVVTPVGAGVLPGAGNGNRINNGIIILTVGHTYDAIARGGFIGPNEPSCQVDKHFTAVP